MKEFDKILDENEKILWQGKPKFWPFFLNSFSFTGMIVGLIFLIVGGFFVF